MRRLLSCTKVRRQRDTGLQREAVEDTLNQITVIIVNLNYTLLFEFEIHRSITEKL